MNKMKSVNTCKHFTWLFLLYGLFSSDTGSNQFLSQKDLALSQTTYFRSLQTERVCR